MCTNLIDLIMLMIVQGKLEVGPSVNLRLSQKSQRVLEDGTFNFHVVLLDMRPISVEEWSWPLIALACDLGKSAWRSSGLGARDQMKGALARLPRYDERGR